MDICLTLASSFLGFFIYYSLYLLIILMDIVLPLFFSILFGIIKDVDALGLHFFHFFERRACIYVALVVSLICFIGFTLLMHEVILIHHFWLFLLLLQHFFVSNTTENLTIIYLEVQFITYLDVKNILFLSAITSTAKNTNINQ